MNIKDEMIPVCGDFALESFASYLGEEDETALEGAMSAAKDSIVSKAKNMTEKLLSKVKETAKGKDAEALKKDKDHISKEQAKVASTAKEARELVIALKENRITKEDFAERFKTATEAVRISKALVGIGSNTELTLQDMKDYTEFLTEAGKIIDEALESVLNPELVEVPVVPMEIDEAAIEGVWNCAYDAYTRNCDAAMEGMNITKKPLTKQEFQAVFNQEKVREDENLRNAIAHGKYSRTELVDMGLLKEDTKDLGKGEYEQLLVDYEKELKEMKGMDESAKAEYVKKHKLPHHLIHCLDGEEVNSYSAFIKSAKTDKKEEKEEKKAEKAEESAKVGDFTIVTKMEEVEDKDKKTAQVKHNEAEAKKVEESIKNQNKQDKMPESDTKKQAPDKMNKAQESVDDTDFLALLESVEELDDEEVIAAIESLIDELNAAESEEAIEGVKDSLREKIEAAKAKVSKKVIQEKADAYVDELKKHYEVCKELDSKVVADNKVGKHYGPALSYPEGFREAHAKCVAILSKIGDVDNDEIKEIKKYCAKWTQKIEESNLAWSEAGESVETEQEPENKEASGEDKSTDKKDIDEAAKKFVEKANIVKEHLVELKPRFARDRKGCAGDVAKVMREVEDLIPYASDITDNDEKIKAYDHIAQQRAALQKALDNIPQDVEEDDSEKQDDEKEETSETKIAVEAKKDDAPSEESKESDEKKDGSSRKVRNLMDNYRRILLNMKKGDNYDDDNLAIEAIHCRTQAKSLMSECNEDDKSDLENIVKQCVTFIVRYAQTIKQE